MMTRLTMVSPALIFRNGTATQGPRSSLRPLACAPSSGAPMIGEGPCGTPSFQLGRFTRVRARTSAYSRQPARE
jgi:hypothetical protein